MNTVQTYNGGGTTANTIEQPATMPTTLGHSRQSLIRMLKREQEWKRAIEQSTQLTLEQSEGLITSFVNTIDATSPLLERITSDEFKELTDEENDLNSRILNNHVRICALINRTLTLHGITDVTLEPVAL